MVSPALHRPDGSGSIFEGWYACCFGDDVSFVRLRETPLRILAPLLAVLALGQTFDAKASEAGYPTRPIRMLLPFAAGGSIDIMARPLAKKLTELLGQTVVVDNRAGAGGSIAAELTAKSPPDGYTLFMASTSPLAITPAVLPKLGYDTVRDLAPVSMVAQQPLIIVGHPSLPVHNVKDLMALAKRQPGKLAYGSAGTGTTNHLVGEMFAAAAGIQLLHVPFKGGAPGVIALLGGEIELQVSQPNTMQPYVKAKRVRAIAVTSAKRWPTYPDVGTLVEAGYKDLDIMGWYCVVGPAGLPRPIVDRLNDAIRKAIAAPEVRDLLLAEGTEPVTGTPESLGTLMRTEVERWGRAVKLAKVRAE